MKRIIKNKGLAIAMAIVVLVIMAGPQIEYDACHQVSRNSDWIEGKQLQNVVYMLGCELDDNGCIHADPVAEYSIAIFYSGSSVGYEKMTQNIPDMGLNLYKRENILLEGIRIPNKIREADNKEILSSLGTKVERNDDGRFEYCTATEQHGYLVLLAEYAIGNDQVFILVF